MDLQVIKMHFNIKCVQPNGLDAWREKKGFEIVVGKSMTHKALVVKNTLIV